jgi:hypothetical protein
MGACLSVDQPKVENLVKEDRFLFFQPTYRDVFGKQDDEPLIIHIVHSYLALALLMRVSQLTHIFPLIMAMRATKFPQRVSAVWMHAAHTSHKNFFATINSIEFSQIQEIFEIFFVLLLAYVAILKSPFIATVAIGLRFGHSVWDQVFILIKGTDLDKKWGKFLINFAIMGLSLYAAVGHYRKVAVTACIAWNATEEILRLVTIGALDHVSDALKIRRLSTHQWIMPAVQCAIVAIVVQNQYDFSKFSVIGQNFVLQPVFALDELLAKRIVYKL